MPDAFGEIDRAAGGGLQQYGAPVAEGRGAQPDVDGDVQQRSPGAVHVLGLPRRHVGEVHSPDHAAAGDAVVGLGQL